MKQIIILFILSLTHLSSFSQINSGADFILASEKSLDAVVHIQSQFLKDEIYRYYDPFLGNLYLNKPREERSSGSGVIISADGYIVTNYHVIQKANSVLITLNNKQEYEAHFVAADPNSDLALLKIDAQNLKPIEFSNSDYAKVGQWVLAVGNPYNLTSTVTAGIISAKGRNVNVLHNPQAVESFIQTDAAINPGNSGGALVNTQGELLGINTAIHSTTGSYMGYGFAIPSNRVQKIVSDLKNYGKVKRAFFGVQVSNINQGIKHRLKLDSLEGVLVAKVIEGGSAINAGIEDWDVIKSIEDVSINSVHQLQEKISQYNPNDTITCKLIRNGKILIVEVLLK